MRTAEQTSLLYLPRKAVLTHRLWGWQHAKRGRWRRRTGGVIPSKAWKHNPENVYINTHAVANCLIFYTVAQLSRILAQLHDEGYPLDPEAVAALSPYRTGYLDRFGHYPLDVTQVPEPLEYDLPIFSTATQ